MLFGWTLSCGRSALAFRVDSKQDVHPKIRNWCARAERSPIQVLRKLKDWGAGDTAEAQLQILEAEGFVDRTRFANAFATDHIRLKNWGPAKVKAALLQVHGITGAMADSALAEVGPVEVDLAALRAAKGWRRIRGSAPEDKALAALLRRGFTFECAKRAVKAAVSD